MYLFLLFLLLFFVYWAASMFGFFDFYLDRCGLEFTESLLAFDGVSVLCLLMLFFCGSVALLFCGHYFGGDASGGRLLGYMLSFFLGVMAFLISSYGLLGTLIMWEYLGVVSFFLILFYSNTDSLRATLITIFASRFGDVCLFGLIFFSLLYWGGSVFLVSSLLLLVVLTKSACFPFISWLLEAMRAPTPVSSLVHSSTLVAAGVWFLFRYGNSFISFHPTLEYLFFVLALSTILISSFCSIVFLDLKKIVALSTCNNVSWCIVFFLMGDTFLGLFQLLCHGVAKCYLFIALGDLMSGSSSAQDSRGVFCSSYSGVLPMSLQAILVFSLAGIPFLGIFFSKHGLLCDLLWSYNASCYVFLFLGLFMTCVYSSRFLGLLSGFNSFSLSSYGSLFLAIVVLSALSSGLNYLSMSGSEEVFLTGEGSSIFLLGSQSLGLIVGLCLYFVPLGRGVSLYGSFVWGCEALVYLFYYLSGCSYSLFLFLSYRWEVGLLHYFSKLAFASGGAFGPSWNSLKFLFISGISALTVFVFFG